MITLSYSEFITAATDRGNPIQYITKDYGYDLYFFDGPFKCKAIVEDSADAADFDANHKDDANKSYTDESGRAINRQAATVRGWTYQFREFEISLSKLNGAESYQENVALTDFTVQIFDSQGTEITQAVNEGNAVRTRIVWSPDFDYEVLGGKLHQHSRPTNNVRMGVCGGPVDLGHTYCKSFVPSMNLKFIQPELQMDTDGRASKYLAKTTTGVPVPTNKFELNFYYTQGDTHCFAIGFEIFKA